MRGQVEIPYDQLPNWADAPANLYHIPGRIGINGDPDQSKVELAKDYLNKHPEILQSAKDNDKDIIISESGRGRELLIGVGVAALATVTAAIVFYRHKRRSKYGKRS